MSEILVVDDEVGIRELLLEILQDEGHQVRLAESATQARAFRNQHRPDMVLLDIWMPDSDGITLLKEWAASGQLTMPVVMMSGHATIDTAVEATRIGAFDFLEKPIGLQKLLGTVGRALRKGEIPSPQALTLASLGKSPLIDTLKKQLSQVANLSVPLLLVGERGAGAESCAHFLHLPNTPFIAPESLSVLGEAPMELLAQAKDGLLYLHEVADLAKVEQKGLLLALGKLDRFNVRLVAATSRSLPALVDSGSFDEALFQALSGLTIKLPSLRDHREDVPYLATRLLTQLVETKEAPLRQLSTGALNALRNYDWPGNIAQLNNIVRTLVVTALNEEITQEDVSRTLSQFSAGPSTGTPLRLDLPLREARDAFERIYFEHHIREESGNMSRVADKVGLERTHLYRKLKQLGIRFSKRDSAEG
ncbi:MAG: sigma-54 dependent transcriptional regulator [Betaproteobacteria bacterium]|nr:sigma-54 dependent transcriptional regulator [Betaproteobacteria bacterium]